MLYRIMCCAALFACLMLGMEAQAGPCDDYYACCLDFARALEAAPGASADGVAQIGALCREVEAMRDDPASMDLCANSLANMRGQAASYDNLEGFRLPASCR